MAAPESAARSDPLVIDEVTRPQEQHVVVAKTHRNDREPALQTHQEGIPTSRPANELGELLVRAWCSRTKPSSASNGTEAAPTCGKSRLRSKSHVVLAFAIVLIFASRKALDENLPQRVGELVGGVFLVASAGAAYLSACHVLAHSPGQLKELGELLLDRSNPLLWRSERLRLFLEVCSWMSFVWYAYTASQSGWLAICCGVIAAMALAFASDFASAYLRCLEEQVRRQNARTFGNVVWLKVLASYGGVGYIMTATWRSLQAFVLGNEVRGAQSVDELVFNFLLITLVGVSLIVASELLLLWDPTRRLGVVLQSRIVDAKVNWETHLWRSLMEVAGTFGATVWYYNSSQDMLVSLQVGTFCGVLLMLSSELLSPSTQPSLFASQPTEIPGDHWSKVIPLVVMVVYFCVKIYGAAMLMIETPSTSSKAVVWWCVGLATLVLSGLTISGARVSVPDITHLWRVLAGKMCVGTITLFAFRYCHGPPGIIFSVVLSVFSLAMSRECWYEVETPYRGKEARSHSCSCDIDADEHDTMPNAELRTVAEDSYSSSFLAYIHYKYPFFYKRVKWTYISLVVVSSLDMCSTFVTALHQDKFAVSLSQFSAANIVLTSTVGYWTSPLQRVLQPDLLLHSGLTQLKKRWMLFPLRALVELAIFIGVFTGTFAASSTFFSSLTLASCSGIVVSVGGHWVCSRLHLTVGNQVRMQLTTTCAMIFYWFVCIYVSVVSLLSIYHYFDSIEAAFCLASFAGIFFLASSEVFLLWEPTRKVGLLLQHRVTHARENWEREPLRSFLELFTWFAIIWGSFALYDDLLLALQLGTFAGTAVVLSGEYFRKNRSRIISWGEQHKLIDVQVRRPPSPDPTLDDDEDELQGRSPRPLSVMLLFAYVGSGTFQWIFENIRSLEVTVFLATVAGIVFLCFADIMVLFKPTRWVGVILQDRFINAKSNWVQYPVRSFVELGSYLGVIYGSYVIYEDLIAATQVGTLSGMLITLGGEHVRSRTRSVPLDDDAKKEIAKVQILPLPMMTLLGLVGVVVFNMIYTHLHNIEVTFLLATTSGIVFALLGDMFVIWRPTRKVGLILQDRIVNLRVNFDVHTQRSCIEWAALTGGWYLSYVYLWPRDLLVAVEFGTSSGMLACVCGDMAVEYLAEVERELIAKLSAKLALDSQKNSKFLNLPFEVQFQVASFLTPEDLLMARTTCHTINNLIKAESARFWLHASLRRNSEDRRQFGERSRGRPGQVRSLIAEAITLVLPMIFGTRDPAYVLTSGHEVSRALKWVYLNADWIRNQHLPVLENSSSSRLVSLTTGDVAFDVFRHMPDKSYLGIVVTRDEDCAIEQIDVPVAIYERIQTDPISFVAAETLSTLEIFSNWHLAVAAFFTMTLIFIGQYGSDLLRAYVFPPSFRWWGVR